MNNIDKFNYFVGRLFADLYGEFPNPMSVSGPIYLEEIVEEDEFDEAFNYQEFVDNSLAWLSNSDYIKVNVLPIYGGHSEYEIVLSEKGLESMKAIPSSLSSDTSFGEMLVDSSKKKAVETVVEVAGKALSYGAGLIVEIS